ncbi:MAG: MFS transporter [Kineosporiaceae bacterium]
MQADEGPPPARSARGGVLRQRGFRALFGADVVSQAGTEVGAFALPVLAVTVLHAGPREMGWLTAAGTAAFLVLGLPAGALVDRWSPRRVLVVNDLLRAALLATVPLAWALDVLTLPQLYAVALAVGACTVFFDVAYQSVLPQLVGPEDLVEANARLQGVASTAQVAGPAAAGGLLRLVHPAVLVGLDAASFLLGALLLRGVRPRPRERSAGPGRQLRAEIAEGLRFVGGHRSLRRIAATTAVANLFGTAAMSMLPLLLLRELGLAPSTVGLLYTAGALGGLLGAVGAGPVTRVLGLGGALLATTAASAVAGAAYPLTALTSLVGVQVGLVVVGGVVGSFAVVVYNIAQVSYRQRLCPPELLGRMNASIRFVVWGTMPLGGLLGGALGERLGVVPTMTVAAVGAALGLLPLVHGSWWRTVSASSPAPEM